jgi:hypothetical protein
MNESFDPKKAEYIKMAQSDDPKVLAMQKEFARRGGVKAQKVLDEKRSAYSEMEYDKQEASNEEMGEILELAPVDDENPDSHPHNKL